MEIFMEFRRLERNTGMGLIPEVNIYVTLPFFSKRKFVYCDIIFKPDIL
jgi:hypothetical protein